MLNSLFSVAYVSLANVCFIHVYSLDPNGECIVAIITVTAGTVIVVQFIIN